MRSNVIRMLRIPRRHRFRRESGDHARETVIYVTVVRFIFPNDQNNIAQGGIIGQLPVVPRGGRCGNVRRTSLVDFFKIKRVTGDRLFFKIADDAVRRARGDQIEQEEADIKNPLRKHHHQALEKSRLSDLDECHQVHALVLCFLHQGTNPAVVIDHTAQAIEMLNRSTDHARNSRNGFEHDGAMAIAFGKKVSAMMRKNFVKTSAK